MNKIFKTFLSFTLAFVLVTLCSSCLTQTPGVATHNYKLDACEKLEFHFNQYNEDDYTVENYQILVDLYEASIKEVKELNLIEDVDKVVENTILNFSEVKKIDKLQLAKDVALSSWESYANAFDEIEDLYTVENFALIQSYLEEGITLINDCLSIESISVVVDVQIERIEAIETIEETNERLLDELIDQTQEEIEAYYSELDLSIYNEEGLTEIADIIDKYFSIIDSATSIEEVEKAYADCIAEIVNVERLPYDISEVKALEEGLTVKVEGVVIGFAGNGTWSEILLRGKNTYDIIGLKSTEVFEKGDVIRFSATITASTNKTETGKKYLASPSEITVVGSNYDTSIDLANATIISSQEDLKNVPTGEEYVVYKFESNNIYANMYESKKDFSKAYLRVSFNKEAEVFDDIKIDNGTGDLISVGFRNNYIAKNLGENWIEYMLGVNEYVAGGYPGHVFSGSIYAIYVGGNGYYAQFTILENDHIVVNEEMKQGRIDGYEQLSNAFNSYEESKYIPENYDILEEINSECEDAIKHSSSVEEIQTAISAAIEKMNAVEKIKVVSSVELVIPTKTTYEQYEAIDLTDGKAVVHFEDNSTYDIELTLDHVSSFSSDNVGEFEVKLKVVFNEVEYVLEYVILVNAAAVKPITVSEAKTKASGETVFVEGVVVGRAGNGTWQEILIKDFVTDDIIGLRNNNGINVKTSAKKGDIIRLNAKITESTNKTEKGKLYLTYIDGLSVVSENNSISYNLENCPSISSQAELETFVLNAKDNAYKIVKLTGDIYANAYGDEFASMYFRFHFNASASKLSEIKIANDSDSTVSAALRNSYVSPNAGESWTNDVFGVTDVVKGTYPGLKFSGSIYVLFAGGNAYYAQFTILEQAHIVKA